MSTRSLRLLITVALVFGVFMYFASEQLNSMLPKKSPDEGKLGGPVPGLTRWQLAKFEEGKALFAKKFSVPEGLGPLYNASSCIECHSEPEHSKEGDELASKGSATDKSVVPESSHLKTDPGSVKQESLSTKKDLVAGKQDLASAKKDLVTAKKDLATAKKEPATAKKDPASATKDPAASNKDLVSKNESTIFATTNDKNRKNELNADARWPELSKATVIMVAKTAKANTNATPPAANNLLTKEEVRSMDKMISEGGPFLVRKSITDDTGNKIPAGCKMQAVTAIPAGTEFVSKRIPHQLYGLGFVESLSDAGLNFSAARQNMEKDSPHGRAVNKQRALSRCPLFGRFGSKNQFSLLISYIANEMGLHMGVSNPLFKHSYSAAGLDKEPECLKTVAKTEPNNDGSDLLKINFYLTTLAPPPRAELDLKGKQGVARGFVVFGSMGCGSCHVTEMQTPDKVMVLNPDQDAQVLRDFREVLPLNPGGQAGFAMDIEPKYIEVRALERKAFHPYSDFLVHDMGEGLSDGMAQDGAGAREWRTTPLWGLRYRKFYLHDGRARSLADAITAHGGEAEGGAKKFKSLTADEKKDLMEFLNSL